MDDRLDELRRSGLERLPRTVEPLPGGRCRVDGRTLWNFTTNDYLDLAADPRVVEAARRALLETGVGARASALVSGRTPWHEQLEERLAAFEGTESAILFPTGYAANVGTLSALVAADDVVFCDRLNHASLVDGCRSSPGRFRVYRHDGLDVLDRELAKAHDTDEAATGSRQSWIVTDGVFSMDGTLAPLDQLSHLAERHGAALVVDEAHGTGVFGAHGRGASEHLGCEGRVDVRIGTLSKALGTLGGFVAGSSAQIAWIRNKARTQIYSTALPPALCAAATAAIDVVDDEPDRRTRLLALCQRLRERLSAEGVPVVPGGIGPIIPIVVGEPGRAMSIGRELEDRGFLVATIRPPTVPRGTSRLRVSLSTAHDETVVDELATAVAEACR